ncbi:MAG: carbamoyl-phosphate synthase (glutamine-hydrolyzing) large subunit [Clostridia bacterium]|nr:carbamoyl-phosphate synthase (glutamine-hydrolyzing) large subunit [Clostridia bacterium]
MPLNETIKKVMVIGSGPIVIGQAAEFDYSGTQACQALKEENIEVVLINSNPATIMTDQSVADRIYIEPITAEFIEMILKEEKPDSILVGMGGQTALNMAIELKEKGILDKYGVNVLGTPIEGIIKGEDREQFKMVMNAIGEPVVESTIVKSIGEGLEFAKITGYPLIIRPAYTLGGTGGGIADDESMLIDILESGLEASPVSQVLLERSIKGWKEVEYEVMRDSRGNKISVCNMENLDPVGIHTGDSIVVAPSQTLSDKEYQLLRQSALNIIEAIGIEGGCNVQFALNPLSFEYAVIEINPRVSRSSALASKATGYPIAKVAAKIALGYGLDEIRNDVTGVTMACFEPSLDYVVVKLPRLPFDKFTTASKVLGTKMMATGETMSIGANFESALLKGIRSLELKIHTLKMEKFESVTVEDLKESAKNADDERLFVLAELLRRDYRIDKLVELTGVDRWFMDKIHVIVKMERALETLTLQDLDENLLRAYKKKGFSDEGISSLMKVDTSEIKRMRKIWSIIPSFQMVDTCGGEFDAVSTYFYSTYERYDEVEVSDRPKVIVIGSGPIRIGQGIEFDYASVHTVKTLKKMGYETIMINNNPETVSTDFNISDKLYFEPLTEEDVMNIIEKEKPIGVMLQFGGQTAIKLSAHLSKHDIHIFGITEEIINRTENRDEFDVFLESIGVSRPKGVILGNKQEGLDSIDSIGFPVIVRPSFVLGGQGMKICYNREMLIQALDAIFIRDYSGFVWMDQFLDGQEVEVDAISDGESVLIPGIMEHLERTGVHSGDSITVYPAQTISKTAIEKVVETTNKIAIKLGIKGVINIQYVLRGEELDVIEVNPRASRTVPYISKVSGVPIVEYATRAAMGESFGSMGIQAGLVPFGSRIAVKMPVFSTQKFTGVDGAVGPEMKSTGEVLGIGSTLEEALYKGFISVNALKGNVKPNILMSLSDVTKAVLHELLSSNSLEQFNLFATPGTAGLLYELGILAVNVIEKCEDLSQTHFDIVINTVTIGSNIERYGYSIRENALKRNIPLFTSFETFKAWLKAYSFDSEQKKIYVL